VEIEVALSDNHTYNPDKDKMLIDFSNLKDIIKHSFLDLLDHNHLNRISGLDYPSAENITLWIRLRLYDVFPDNVRLARIRVWESEDSYAEWRLV
jgi:6-pyruvoyl-tetrahydropterin synthase